jgi:hypothetical protein
MSRKHIRNSTHANPPGGVSSLLLRVSPRQCLLRLRSRPARLSQAVFRLRQIEEDLLALTCLLTVTPAVVLCEIETDDFWSLALWRAARGLSN